jgi:hypothetical protein
MYSILVIFVRCSLCYHWVIIVVIILTVFFVAICAATGFPCFMYIIPPFSIIVAPLLLFVVGSVGLALISLSVLGLHVSCLHTPSSPSCCWSLVPYLLLSLSLSLFSEAAVVVGGGLAVARPG